MHAKLIEMQSDGNSHHSLNPPENFSADVAEPLCTRFRWQLSMLLPKMLQKAGHNASFG